MKNDSTILLIEDDKVDIMTVQRAFKQNNITNTLEVKQNGEDALEYLRQEEPDGEEDFVLPGLILLDLNMPKMNGVEFLKIVKSDERLKSIPVVVLTTSKEENDRCESFNIGVAGYIIKPVDFNKFVEVIKLINMYWTLSESP